MYTFATLENETQTIEIPENLNTPSQGLGFVFLGIKIRTQRNNLVVIHRLSFSMMRMHPSDTVKPVVSLKAIFLVHRATASLDSPMPSDTVTGGVLQVELPRWMRKVFGTIFSISFYYCGATATATTITDTATATSSNYCLQILLPATNTAINVAAAAAPTTTTA